MKTFVEIGSSDFDTCASLLDRGWCGVIVEPVKELLDNIPDHHNLIKKNIAISDYNGTIDMMVCLDYELSFFSWGRGISHVISNNHLGWKMLLDPSHHKTRKEPRQVPCMTLDALIDQHNIKSIDYLKLDTEGHELNILKSFSFKVRPSFIKCEHKHLDENLLNNLLKSHAYIVYQETDDIYAVG